MNKLKSIIILLLVVLLVGCGKEESGNNGLSK